MAISAPDLANMRTGQQVVFSHLNVTPPVVIGTARINQSAFSYPLGALTVDTVSLNGGLSSLADVPVGSLVWVGTTAGAHDVLTTVVRKPCTPTTLYISGMSRGDPGRAVYAPQALANDQYVTILAIKPLWGLLSRVLSTGAIYKQFDVPYTDQGSNPSPVCNIGRWRRVRLGSGGTVDVTFTNAAIAGVKPASRAWGSKTIAAYSWWWRDQSYNLNAGGVFVGGSTSEAATIRFEAAGFYIVYCQVTDSAGKTHTAEVYVWVEDGTGAVDLDGWRFESLHRNRSHAQGTLVLRGEVAESAVFPGAAFLYSKEVFFNGATVAEGAIVDSFVGHVTEERRFRDWRRGHVQFTLLGPMGMLAQVPAASQYIEEVASPTSWTQIGPELSHPDGVAWYVLQHHCPAALQLFDFWGLGDTDLRDNTWALTQRSVAGQLREVAPLQINVGSAACGAICLRHDPLLMSDAARDALDVHMTWTAEDVDGERGLEYPETFALRVGQVDAYAFSWDGSRLKPYWSRAPGDAQAQGVGVELHNGFILPAGSAQADLERVAGHLFARANNPASQVSFRAMRNLDTVDPAKMVWHRLDIPPALDPRGIGIPNRRAVPVESSSSWEETPGGALLERIEVTFEVETRGQPGIYKPVPVEQENQWLPPAWNLDLDFGLEYYDPPQPIVEGVTVPTDLLAFHADGPWCAFAGTADGWASAPNWQDRSAGLSGSVRWATADPHNYRRYFVVTTEGVFRSEDPRGGQPWVRLMGNELLPSGYTWHGILMSINRQGWIMLLGGQHYVAVSFDYGATWQVTRTGSGNAAGYRAQAAISPYSTLTDSLIYLHVAKLLYVSTDWGLSWSLRFNFQTGLFNIYNTGTVVVPYRRPGGEPNNDHAAQHLWIQLGQRGGVGSATPVAKSTNSGTTWTAYYSGAVAGDPAGWPSPSARNIVAYTQDGGHVAWLTRKQQVLTYDSRCYFFYTENAAAPFTQSASSPYTGAQTVEYVFLNGFPYNPDFYIAGGHWVSDGFLKLTKDRGASWVDLTGNLVTGGIFPTMRVVCAEAGLEAYT